MEGLRTNTWDWDKIVVVEDIELKVLSTSPLSKQDSYSVVHHP